MPLQAREILSLDSGWRFHLGDIDAPLANTHIAAYMANKAGYARGAAKPAYDDSDWRIVDLPHDWSVEGDFDPQNQVDAGFLPRGIAWYRRHFQLEESNRGKYLAIQFDGVATHCTVHVNGHVLQRNFCGYTPFTIDISDVANFGDQLNCIAVRVDATDMEGWWYEGAGIYRHVRLMKTAPIHIAVYGTFVNSVRRSNSAWETKIETMLENSSDSEARVSVRCILSDFDGKAVGFVESAVDVPARSTVAMDQAISVEQPALWSIESPYLYRLYAELLRDGATIDDEVTSFGFRTIRLDPDEGFFLNDQHVKLKGTCIHQDHAGVGVAVPDSIHEFRIRRLKEMGCNAIRCAHNPPAPELLDACDRLGMLVIDENRNFGSTPEHLEQLRKMILRDRNHPSVILWSTCNEEAIQGTPAGARIARAMQHEITLLDESRAVTAAVSGGVLNDDCIADSIQVMGLNYQLPLQEKYHHKRPNVPLLAAETHCVLSTRGVYKTDPEKFYFASDDSEAAFWGNSARETWRAVSSRTYVAGLFIWTGFDYRGEPSPHHWPCVNSHFGIMDTCGFAKDSFFLHKTYFTSDPFVHLLPHWNWRGSDGAPIRVIAYTNCESVELFLNDESLGRKSVDSIEMVEWHVPYRPGTLRALAFSKGTSCQCIVETTDDPVALGLEIHPSFDASQIPADGEFALPITVFAIDAVGRRVPTANHFVTLAISGPAKIIGVGNGNPTCHEPDKASSRSLFNGLAQVIVQTITTPGKIVVVASTPGLRDAQLCFESTAASPRSSLPPAQVRHFVSDWRMSQITRDRPDLRQQIPEHDMNSWERIDPTRGAQSAWKGASGYAIYRAAFTAPKYLQATGGRIVFHSVAGAAEFYVNDAPAGAKQSPPSEPVEIRFPSASGKIALTVLVTGNGQLSGIVGPVELLPVCTT